MNAAPFVLALVVTTPAPTPDAAAQTGTITDTVSVEVRERQNGDYSLLIAVGGDPEPVDALRLTLPEKVAWKPGLLSPGWTFKVDGKHLDLSGPSPRPKDRIFFRFDIAPQLLDADDFIGKKCRVRGERERRVKFDFEPVIQLRPKVTTADILDGALNLPPLASEGDPFFGTIAPSHGPTHGTWTLRIRDDGMTGIDPKRLDEIDTPPADVYRDLSGLTGLLKPFYGRVHPDLRFTFTDLYGETLIDAPADWRVVPRPDTCVASITGGSTLAFAGKQACVTGCFGAVGSDFRLRLDTEDLGILAASWQTLVVDIPAPVTPGPHWVTAVSPGGSKASDRHQIQVLHLKGTIDMNDILRGASTTMRLDILGSDAKLPLQVINRSPWVVDVEGGVRQTITTPGGAANGVTRNVRGIRKGDFAIDYSLNLPPCGLPQ